MTKTEGVGSAEDAGVSTDAEVVEQEDPRPALEAAVKSAQAKVKRQQEHLEGAKQALADAQSALKES